MDMKTFAQLLRNYARDAMPGGELNRELTPERLKEAALLGMDFTPVVGDIKSGYEAVDAAKQGNYGEAALNAAGLLPFVPSLGGMIRTTKVSKLPLDPGAYTAVSKGSAGHDVLLNGEVVGSTMGKLKDATKSFVDEVTAELQKRLAKKTQANINAGKRAEIKQSQQMLDDAYKQNADLINSIHKKNELTFNPLPDNSAWEQGKFIYQSPNYGKKQGSSYRLIDVNGEPAYARQSDHWGLFSARDANDFEKWNDYNWILENAAKDQRSTGYILLKDLMNKAGG